MKTTHLALLVGLFMGAVLAFGSFANFVLVALYCSPRPFLRKVMGTVG